jgi:pimeloyl-ACP methyl ester carboxylesterase
MFAAVFPERVERLVVLDLVKLIAFAAEDQPKRTARHVSQYFNFEMEMHRSRKPTYTKDEALARLLKAVPSLTANSGMILLDRGLQPVDEETDGERRYSYRRDIRVSFTSAMHMSFEQQKPFLSRISCPMLLVKATDSPKYEGEEMFDAARKLFEETNTRFEYVEVHGGHHVHINHPERVASLINDFLLRDLN